MLRPRFMAYKFMKCKTSHHSLRQTKIAFKENLSGIPMYNAVRLLFGIFDIL